MDDNQETEERTESKTHIQNSRLRWVALMEHTSSSLETKFVVYIWIVALLHTAEQGDKLIVYN